jgi:hypothetical protein
VHHPLRRREEKEKYGLPSDQLLRTLSLSPFVEPSLRVCSLLFGDEVA